VFIPSRARTPTISTALKLATIVIGFVACADGNAPSVEPVTITGIVPNVGTAYGGTPITITGSGFRPGSTVRIGAETLNEVHVVSATEITAVTGPENVDTVDVVVTSGRQVATLPGAFAFLLPFTAESVTPATGSTDGSTIVTVTGRNFVPGMTIAFGAAPPRGVQFVSPTTINAVALAQPSGTVDVRLASPIASVVLARAFAFVDPRIARDSALTQRYADRFGEDVPVPAVHNALACNNSSHLTTTAYIDHSGNSSTLMWMYTTADGATVTRSWTDRFLKPAGTIRVLLLVVGYAQTMSESAFAGWSDAQAAINGDHAAYASGKGFAAPIVIFENTNVFIDATEVADPRTPEGVAAALATRNVSTEGYDLVAAVNIEPGRGEGGFAIPWIAPGFMYIGNFSGWAAPLTASAQTSIARALYHHEVAHHWGWPGTHDWACSTEAYNFRVPPRLLGWEDVDHDGVPEILDPTPYGRTASP